MNMFESFDENPAMTLQDIKETKRNGRTHAQMDHMKTVYPPQTKFAGGIKISIKCAHNRRCTCSMYELSLCKV